MEVGKLCNDKIKSTEQYNNIIIKDTIQLNVAQGVKMKIHTYTTKKRQKDIRGRDTERHRGSYMQIEDCQRNASSNQKQSIQSHSERMTAAYWPLAVLHFKTELDFTLSDV